MNTPAPKTYKIHHSPVRTKRGMPGWAVMELQAPIEGEDKVFGGGVWYGVEAFHTKEEAEALLADLEAEAKS